jgi:hypothetical protein
MNPREMEFFNEGGVCCSLQDDECSVCLQVLFSPVVLQPCEHHYCEQCWQRVAEAADLEDRVATCPVCRSTPSAMALNPVLDEAVRLRRPSEWRDRARRHETEQQVKLRCQRQAESESMALAAAMAELEEAEETTSPDGRVTRRMTAALISRCVKAQCTEYRTAALASRLELALLGLRDISPALSQYSLLTSLRLEHNAIQSLAGLQLPLLKVHAA